jgi:Protein of unknown function (DUF1186)/SEC-C motif
MRAPRPRQTMTIPEILKELELYTGRFPRQAMQAAIEQREAITPELLRVLERAAEDPVKFAEQKDYMLHLFGMYLLAQFRERRAYRPLVRIFSAPGETPFDLAGDTVTERLKCIFGSVYDGDPTPLQALVEDGNANEYVRNAAMDVFVVLKESGQMSREDVVAYYRSLFGKFKRTFSEAWNGLVTAVADLPAPELLEEVRQAYRDDLVESGVADLKGIERELLRPESWGRDRFALITDAIASMEWWACFHRDGTPSRKPTRRVRSSSGPSPAPPQLLRTAKIGRNDPCPCGSGKKYKKCCARN